MLKILLGNDPYLEKQYFEQMLNTLGFQKDNFDLRRFSTFDRHFTFDMVDEALYTPSLFFDGIMVVLECYDLKKEQELALLELMSRDFSQDHLLLIFKQKPKGNTKLGRLAKKLKAIDLDKESQTGFSRHVEQRLANAQIQIEAKAKSALIERVNHNYQQLSLELDKLAVLDRLVTLADIERLVVKNLEDDVFALSDAVLQKKQVQAFAIYQDLQSQGMDPLQLIGLMGSSIRRIFQVSVLAQHGYQATSIAEYCAMSDRQVYFLMKNRQQDYRQLLPLMQDLSVLDYRVKKGYLDKDLAFDLWLLEATN